MSEGPHIVVVTGLWVWLDELALKRLKHFQEMSGRTQTDVISDGLRALDMVERKVSAELEAKKNNR